MTAQAETLRGFDRSPVPARSAIAVRPAGSKKLGRVSDYVDDLDPFAGVFALFLLLALLTALFVLQLGAIFHPPAQPTPLTVSLVVEPAPVPEQAPAPPPASMTLQRNSFSIGKEKDPTDSGSKENEAAGRPVAGPLSTPSENRLLNELPKPMSSEVVDPRASTAATPVPFNADAQKNNAEKDPRSAAAESKPAGTVTQAVVPTTPDEGELGGKQDGGEGAMMAAGVIQGAKPQYPMTARKQGLEGTVLLRVSVAPDGRITSVMVVRSSGHLMLDKAARDGVARWRFSAARRGGGAIASVVDIPIEFKLNN